MVDNPPVQGEEPEVAELDADPIGGNASRTARGLGILIGTEVVRVQEGVEARTGYKANEHPGVAPRLR